MKKKYALSIVVTSTLGIIFILINTLFFEEKTNQFLSALALFKYFTIQSNLIVTIYFYLYVFTSLKEKNIFNKMLGGVVIYISITFLVFLLFLEPIYSPEGFALAGSILNHYISPLLVMIFVYKFRDDYSFEMANIKIWIIYPLVYFAFLVINGVITNNYLYPFFQVSEVGVIGIIVSAVGIVVLFLIMSFTIVKIVSKK